MPTILSGAPPGAPPQPKRKPTWFDRFRALLRLPHPVVTRDPVERDKSLAEWQREVPKLLDDLFFIIQDRLGEEETRILFSGTSQRAAPRDANRPANVAFKMICLDTYDLI